MGSATIFPSTATEEIAMESKWTSPKGQSILVPSLMLWILNVLTFSGKHFAIQVWKNASLWSFNNCKPKNYQQICHGIFNSEGPDRRTKLLTEILVLLARDLNWRNTSVCSVFMVPKVVGLEAIFNFSGFAIRFWGKTWKNDIFSEACKMPKLFRKCRCEKKFLVTVTPTKLQSKNLEEAKSGSRYRKWMLNNSVTMCY